MQSIEEMAYIRGSAHGYICLTKKIICVNSYGDGMVDFELYWDKAGGGEVWLNGP